MDPLNQRVYTLLSEHDCDRLELQARIAGLEGYLRHVRTRRPTRILDAGSGSGAMSRLFASKFPDANVLGIDLDASHVEYAAAHCDQPRVMFRQGDAQAIPLEDESFDIVWSAQVLFFVTSPARAVAEFRRVAKRGGEVIVVLDYWPALVLDPDDGPLRSTVLTVAQGLADIALPSRLPTMFRQAGFARVTVEVEESRVYTVVGSFDTDRRRNHAIELQAARPHVVGILGSEAACDDFYRAWFAYLDRPDTSTIVPEWFVRGEA